MAARGLAAPGLDGVRCSEHEVPAAAEVLEEAFAPEFLNQFDALLLYANWTTLKPEHETTRPYVELWPDTFTIEAYFHVFQRTSIGIWLVNSTIVSIATTVLVVACPTPSVPPRAARP